MWALRRSLYPENEKKAHGCQGATGESLWSQQTWTPEIEANPKRGHILLPKMHAEQEGEVWGVRCSKGWGWGGVRGQRQATSQRSGSFQRGTKERRQRDWKQVQDVPKEGARGCAKGPPRWRLPTDVSPGRDPIWESSLVSPAKKCTEQDCSSYLSG